MRVAYYARKAWIPKSVRTVAKSLPLVRKLYNRVDIVYGYRECLRAEVPVRTPSSPAERGDVKRALLSYLTIPLQVPKRERAHMLFGPYGLAQCIPQVLNELGYEVDIVAYCNRDFLPRRAYDLFIGHAGINFEHIATNLPVEIPKIYFATGLYWRTANARERERLDALWRRRGERLPCRRSVAASEDYGNAHSDGIICLGNRNAAESYRDFPRVINVNNVVAPVAPEVLQKDYEAGRHGFLFFSGTGNVHKGLDLLLEVFSKLEDDLYICQPIEPNFARVYAKELFHRPNIHVVGHIPMRSKEFHALTEKCNYVISATCAEGQPGAVLECMGHGLIPVLGAEANIDAKDFGFLFSETTIPGITSMVRAVSQNSAEECRERANLAFQEIRANYSEEGFLRDTKNAISAIVSETPCRTH